MPLGHYTVKQPQIIKINCKFQPTNLLRKMALSWWYPSFITDSNLFASKLKLIFAELDDIFKEESDNENFICFEKSSYHRIQFDFHCNLLSWFEFGAKFAKSQPRSNVNKNNSSKQLAIIKPNVSHRNPIFVAHLEISFQLFDDDNSSA